MMDQASKIVYINSQIACFVAEIEGMKAENAERALAGFSPAYTHKEFVELPAQYGLSHNQVVQFLSEDTT